MSSGGLNWMALWHIRYIHFVVFSVSWVIFFIVGKIYFEYALGSYHSSGSKLWAFSCKLLFLITFIIACTLLELLSLEILDLMHAQLRECAWTITLGLLCILLNVLIPASIVISIGLQIGLSNLQIGFYCINLVILFQFLMWVSGEILPLSIKGQHSSLLHYILSLPFDVQQSVAHLTVIGSATAAIISGFATVNFPLQQLMVFRGVDSTLLKKRQETLKLLMNDLCTKKKQLLYITRKYPRENDSKMEKSSKIKQIPTLSDILYSIPVVNNLQDLAYRQLYPTLKRKNSFRGIDDFEANNLPIVVSRNENIMSNNKNNLNSSPPDDGLSDSNYSCPNYEYTAVMQTIYSQEQVIEDLFFEILHLKDFVEQSYLSQTIWGRILRIMGYLCSAVGIFRVYVGSFHIIAHFMGEHTLFYNNNSQDEEDMVTTFTNFLVTHLNLKVDEFLWPPALTFLMVGVLSLMQVRVFMITVQDFARFGFLSTNTEVYSLFLSHFAGVYFVACVVLLRIQLPLRRRLAVTAALGKDIQFDFFLFWFDLFFVLSAIFFGVVLLIHHARKQRLLDLSLEKYKTELGGSILDDDDGLDRSLQSAV